MFDLLFKKKKSLTPDPKIRFGRYSDNNKTPEKVNSWISAETLFTEGKYFESIEKFFDYLLDEIEQNIYFTRISAENYQFEIYQGSKVVRGLVNSEGLMAEVFLARMPEANVPVMRRLLDMNFKLFHSRYALRDQTLMMRFDIPAALANPNKLYYGLKELATRADKQDDLLVQEFGSLSPLDTRHLKELPEEEKEIKYHYFQQWISSSLEYIDSLDEDKFSGAISYLLLCLVFRIDFLIRPEGKLLSELESVVDKYYAQTEKNAIIRNQEMKESLAKLRSWSKEEVIRNFFRSKYSFSIVSPAAFEKVAESLNQSLQNMVWYRDNNFRLIANEVMEFGMAYNQFSYSLPRPLVELHKLFMQVNHSLFFKDLGFSPALYDLAKSQFNTDALIEKITEIVERWKPKYSTLGINIRNLRFNSLLHFNQSFIKEISSLKLDS